MVVLSIYKKESAESEFPQYGPYGKYSKSMMRFDTPLIAFDYIISEYKKDKTFLTPWSAVFLNGFDGDMIGGILVDGSKQFSLDAYRLVVIVNKLLRNQKNAKRKLKVSELGTLKNDLIRICGIPNFDRQMGVKEKGKMIWQ